MSTIWNWLVKKPWQWILGKFGIVVGLKDLYAFRTRLVEAKDNPERVTVLVEFGQWLATKTDTPMDDKLIGSFHAMLVTPAGQEFVRDVSDAISQSIGEPK